MLRSMLFAPANHPRRVEKALSSPADAAILDIEDSVAVEEKPAARLAARAAVAGRAAEGPLAYIRVNALTTPFAYEDLRTVVVRGLDGVMLPKVEAPEHLCIADWLLTQVEREQGLAEGSIDLLPILETAAGVMRAAEIARATRRVRHFAFGAGDFTLDTNMTWSAGNEGILWARIQLVLVARAAGLEPPMDTVFADLTNPAGFRAETEQALRLGFQGKTCIHPDQVTVVNEIFTPSAAEVAAAQRVVEAFAAAEAAGNAAIRVDGQFVDYPVADRARRLLARAAHSTRGGGGA